MRSDQMLMPPLQGPLVGEKRSSQAITEEYAKADPIYVAKTSVSICRRQLGPPLMCARRYHRNIRIIDRSWEMAIVDGGVRAPRTMMLQLALVQATDGRQIDH